VHDSGYVIYLGCVVLAKFVWGPTTNLSATRLPISCGEKPVGHIVRLSLMLSLVEICEQLIDKKNYSGNRKQK